ncbi:ankyrin repeat protein [Flavobacterium arsenatis]|uniref:Ankyrin repeat protein n=1 Tax=Flavobacterium arsenatis TaxID=1484332 RepID=A0ABU1TPD7_9FLAO|nr:ankyrin repeat domain-containing protein [Flavobacterium arsenatis]MDR6967835.1 ankyrin repeat protein [Flavobacterium arsenatis]
MKKLIYKALFFFVSKNAFSHNDIFEIARKGSVEEIIQTLKDNPNLANKNNKEGLTPLILACQRGNDEVANYLINTFENVNISNDFGAALMTCAIKGNSIIAKLLLEKKANPNIKDAEGNTALIYAVQFRKFELVKLLLDYNADRKIRDNLGKTAFEYAAFSNEERLVNLLK